MLFIIQNSVNSYCRSNFQYDSLDPGFNFDREITTFGVFQIGMTSTDVATDSIQAYDYYKTENYWWASSTLTIMFVPMFTSFCSESLNNVIKYYRGEEFSWRVSFKKIGRHFFIAQPIVHLMYFLTLRSAKNAMLKAKKFYKKFDSNDVKINYGEFYDNVTSM